MVPVPVTLATAAACSFINVWLGARIASFRHQFKVSVGDGGHEPLLRRMRAQANFIENAPFVLILLGGLELSGANRWLLAALAALFLLARIAHPFGMDGGDAARWRKYGIQATGLVTVALSAWAAFLCVEYLLRR